MPTLHNMANAQRDGNFVPTLIAASNVDGITPVVLWADPTTHRLLVATSVGNLSSLTDVTITGAAQGDVLYWNGTKWVNLGAGTNGQVLTTAGAGANPSWTTISGTAPFSDAAALVKNSADATKLAILSAASITTGTTRTYTLPDVTGTLTALGNASTGSGSVVLATTPTLVTPVLGVATATSVNKVAFTAPAASATLTIANTKTLTANSSLTLAGVDAKTLTVNNTLTLAGTDATTMTFPTTSATIARTDAANTFTGHQTIEGVTATGATGTGLMVFGTNPTIVKPALDATNPTAQTYSPGVAGTATLDCSLGNEHRITMPAGNITIAVSNDTNAQKFIVSILQDGTGSRTVTWFTTIRWAGGSAPTLTTTASKRDTFGFIRTGAATYDAFVIGQNI